MNTLSDSLAKQNLLRILLLLVKQRGFRRRGVYRRPVAVLPLAVPLAVE
jgi:hypothetical protein